ncbi:MAG: hypothetical protein DRP93_03125 [Candidatus Neomarinimicrobiota bacterium]|nr:MAG: hypothetical protein DRP93_03125 [Candidatus Neomarinimicrobiota bacterium]
MSLYGIASDEAGIESTGQYTVAMAESDARMTADLEQAGTEINVMSDGIILAEDYLDGLGRMISVDGAIMADGAGVESHKVAMATYLTLGKTIVGTGAEQGLIDAGTEGKLADYYNKALILARKAWVNVKKIAMKAIAKLIGMVQFRTGKIKDLELAIEKRTAWNAVEFKKETKEALKNKCSVFATSGNSVTGNILQTYMDNQLEAAQGFGKVDSGKIVLTTYKEKVKELGTKLTKELGDGTVVITDPKITKLFKNINVGKDDVAHIIPGINNYKYIVVSGETGKVTYQSASYGDIKESDITYVPLNKVECEQLLESVKTGNANFSSRVDTAFGVVEKTSKEMDKELEAFNASDKDEDAKKIFRVKKSFYSLTPRVAFDAVLNVNRAINFGTALIEDSIDAHKKVEKDTKK